MNQFSTFLTFAGITDRLTVLFLFTCIFKTSAAGSIHHIFGNHSFSDHFLQVAVHGRRSHRNSLILKILTDLIYSHMAALNRFHIGNGFQIDTIQLSSILQRKITYAIILSGKRENSSIMVQTTSESPRNGSSGGFLFRFWIWWFKPQAGYRLFVTIQPFDDVVAGYTSRDSDNERENIIHNSSPPFRTWYRRR